MIRSFGYARAMGSHSADWEKANVAALIDAYGAAADDTVLAAYVVDKAAYEVVYETNNRPEWVDIPISAIADLTQS